MRWPEKLPTDPAKPQFIVVGPGAIATDLVAGFPRLLRAGPEASELKLIRPDAYIGFVGTASDRSAAETYLQTLVR